MVSCLTNHFEIINRAPGKNAAAQGNMYDKMVERRAGSELQLRTLESSE